MSIDHILSIFKNLPDSIIATTHKDPDYDAIGSLLALNSLINHFGKSITLYCHGFNASQFNLFFDVDKIITTPPNQVYDLAFFLDCSDKNRISSFDKFPTVKSIVNIDHHQDNTNFGDINFIEEISSTGELIYNLFNKLNIPIDLNTATYLFAAISFDTGSFKFSNTTESTFLAAASLIKTGIDISTISNYIFDTKPTQYFNDIGYGLNNLYTDDTFPFIIVHIPNHSHLSNISTVDFFRQYAGTELTVICKEVKKSEYKLSFRSKQYVNVAAIAKYFNGGGHTKAAGGSANGSFNTIKASLITHCKEAFK